MYPKRIACLTTESAEIVYALGAGERVAGISGFVTRPPEAREKPKVSSFTSVRMDKIREVNPDLVILFSDLQAQIAHDLVKEGYTVLALNQRSLEETFQAIELIGRTIGETDHALKLVSDMKAEMQGMRIHSMQFKERPHIYFEEWDDPLITGIRWVSELIEIAGGEDIFPEMRERKNASERKISANEVFRRDPDVIIASWCGKKVNLDAIRNRPGWEQIKAVKNNEVHEIKSPDILSPGPSLMHGLKQMHKIIADSVERTADRK